MKLPLLMLSALLFVHAQEPAPPTLTIGTDEVHITFHALDFQGRPTPTLTSQDVKILDNGKPPLRIVSFEHLGNLPIRAGFLFDTSRSMGGQIDADKATAKLYASDLLRVGMDQAFVMRFDFDQKLLQPWTDDKGDLLHGLKAVGNDFSSRIGGTRIYDSLYRACRDQWQQRPPLATANFILLFSDGDDNASRAYFSEAVEMCQQRQVAIYVVTREAKSRSDSGQRMLQELSKQTGGSITFANTETEVSAALSLIRTTVEDRYTVIYKPRTIKRNGEFHKWKLDCTQPCFEVRYPSGYYAPK